MIDLYRVITLEDFSFWVGVPEEFEELIQGDEFEWEPQVMHPNKTILGPSRELESVVDLAVSNDILFLKLHPKKLSDVHHLMIEFLSGKEMFNPLRFKISKRMKSVSRNGDSP